MGSERWVYWMIPTHFRCYALYVSNSKQKKKKNIVKSKTYVHIVGNLKKYGTFWTLFNDLSFIRQDFENLQTICGFSWERVRGISVRVFFSSGRRLFLIVACKFCKGLISITTKTRAKMEKKCSFLLDTKRSEKSLQYKKNIKIKLFKFLTISVH